MIAIKEKSLNLLCDCHNKQTMLRVIDGVIFVERETHREGHTLRLPLDELLALVLASQPKQ